MVLRHLLLATVLLAGCKQSLFSNHGGDDVTGDANGGDGNGSNGDGMVQQMCGAGCIADAAADFGTSKWKYFDDHRDRTWAAMTMSGSDYVGANPANKIAPGSGTVLVSTAGMSDGADPAIAFTADANKTIKLSFIVDIPGTAPSHTVRLYRNSREDSLFTQIGLGGTRVEKSLTVDALTNDRFMLVLAPNGTGGANISVSFFVNETTTIFPSECQVALQFSPSTAHTTGNPCGQTVTYYHNDGGNSYTGMTPTNVPTSAYAELDPAADIPVDFLYSGDTPLQRSGDTTTQFWIQHRTLDTTYDTVLFSDEDCDMMFGGLIVYRHPNGQVGIESCTSSTSSVSGEGGYPSPPTGWHFIRVVHTAGKVNLCIDGTKITSYNLPAAAMHTAYPFELGQNNDFSPVVAVLDAAMDDVRVFSTALPCE